MAGKSNNFNNSAATEGQKEDLKILENLAGNEELKSNSPSNPDSRGTTGNSEHGEAKKKKRKGKKPWVGYLLVGELCIMYIYIYIYIDIY